MYNGVKKVQSAFYGALFYFQKSNHSWFQTDILKKGGEVKGAKKELGGPRWHKRASL